MGIINRQQGRQVDAKAMAAPGSVQAPRRLQFDALGTRCEVQYHTPSDQKAAAFERDAKGWVAAFEAKYSRFRPDSLISRINAAAGKGWTEIDPEAEQMLKLCGSLCFMTRGILDATALPLLRLWDYRRKHSQLPSAQEISEARRLVGWAKVQLAPGKVFLPETGMALDFGGFGKEWAVDMVARIAAERGIEAALVDFGHDIRSFGTPPGRPAWHIGLEDPLKPGSLRGSMALTPGLGVASSGDYIRHFIVDGKRYGHIIDPRSGMPVSNGCLQVTVVADTCLRAGILSTTAFVLGLTEGPAFIQATPGAEGILVSATTRAQTRGFWQYELA
jgi:thiamine biosynthesis lipoprotein